jgi:hypothetical protein
MVWLDAVTRARAFVRTAEVDMKDTFGWLSGILDA